MNATTQTPNWWDEPGDASRRNEDRDYIRMACDRLSLAWICQQESGGDPTIAERIDRWHRDLKRRPTALATVITVLHGLDRLDRHACEPPAWQHLIAAENALAAYIALARQS